MGIDHKLKDIKIITISNTFNNNNIEIPLKKFKKFCNIYKLTSELYAIPVEFGKEVGFFIRKTIITGQIAKPHDFEIFTQFVEILDYLGVTGDEF